MGTFYTDSDGYCIVQGTDDGMFVENTGGFLSAAYYYGQGGPKWEEDILEAKFFKDKKAAERAAEEHGGIVTHANCYTNSRSPSRI